MNMPANKQLDHAQASSQLKPQGNRQIQKFPISILANDINIAGNVGSLFRIADALGVEKLYLTGKTATPPKYKIRKAARSSDKHIDYEYCESAVELIGRLKSSNTQIICLEITELSVDIRKFTLELSAPEVSDPVLSDKESTLCLVIGSENEGISQEILSLADQTVHIPMYGENSSMNVSTSCAIAIHELIQHFQKHFQN